MDLLHMAPTVQAPRVLNKALAIPRRRIGHLKFRWDNQWFRLMFVHVLDHDWRLRVFLHDFETSLRVFWSCNRNEVVMYVDRYASIFSVGPFVIFLAHIPDSRDLIPNCRLGIKCDDTI